MAQVFSSGRPETHLHRRCRAQQVHHRRTNCVCPIALARARTLPTYRSAPEHQQQTTKTPLANQGPLQALQALFGNTNNLESADKRWEVPKSA
eukprot:2584395-Alexandrium_andersonii.AAC.1